MVQTGRARVAARRLLQAAAVTPHTVSVALHRIAAPTQPPQQPLRQGDGRMTHHFGDESSASDCTIFASLRLSSMEPGVRIWIRDDAQAWVEALVLEKVCARVCVCGRVCCPSDAAATPLSRQLRHTRGGCCCPLALQCTPWCVCRCYL
jgi:hypothetical protein